MNIQFTDRFKKDLKRLVRKFRSFRSDVDGLVEQLQRGELPGDRIPGAGYIVYKVRIGSRDQQKGKRGGFRVIYYVQTAERLLLITIYAKAEQEDVSVETVQRLIEGTDSV